MVVCRDELFTFNIICAEVIRNAHFLRDTMKVKNCTNRNPFIAGYFRLVMLSSAVGISLPWKASFLLILKYIGCLAICKIQFGINNYFLVWLVLQISYCWRRIKIRCQRKMTRKFYCETIGFCIISIIFRMKIDKYPVYIIYRNFYIFNIFWDKMQTSL